MSGRKLKVSESDGGFGFAEASAAARFIRAKLGKPTPLPKVAAILGSGLGSLARELTGARSIPYKTIPHFPVSTAVGHAGELVIGKLAGTSLAVMSGRAHFYEGYSPRAITFPVRVLGLLGIRALVVTNAAGGINLEYGEGRLVLIRDHIHLQGGNPLRGPNDDRFGPRFPDMSEAYSKELRGLAQKEAARLGQKLSEGVYAAVPGPSYETPAEIRFLRTIGADLVGMSTIPEVIVARHMGIKVLGISCVTNMAAGILDQPINHEEVLDVGRRVQGEFLALLRAVIPRISAASK